MAKNYMVLYGRNSVYERLKARPANVRKVFMREGLCLPQMEELIEKNSIAVERVPAEKLASMRPAKDLQGVMARVDRYEYADFDAILERGGLTPIFLDRINDPQNLGVIMRVAACFGGFALVIPRFQACEVNETVLHVASGGENYCPVSMVSNIANAIVKAKGRGYWIVGADVGDDAEDIGGVSLPLPLALIMGSEGEGIRPVIQKHVDIKARIPMEGAKLSFNVSVACAIICHEIAKQRG